MSDLDSLSREELVAALAERDAVIEVLLAELVRVLVELANTTKPAQQMGIMPISA